MILEQLRQQTRAHHEALESALPLGTAALDPSLYDRLLQRFWGFYATWEQASRQTAQPPLDQVLDARRKLPLLDADLRARSCFHATLPRLPVSALPNFTLGEPVLLGSMYVIEGATLGGQVISRGLERQGFRDGIGYSFFLSYGRTAGQQWRAFTGLLERIPEDRGDEAVGAARQTFQAFADWFATAGFRAQTNS